MWRKFRPELFLPLAFLALIILAEVGLTFESLSAGMTIHMMTLFCLILVASTVHSWSPDLSKFLVALTLLPLIRMFSTSTPFWPFGDTLVWLGVISLPMLVAAFTTIQVQKMKREDYGFILGPLKGLPIQLSIIVFGIPLGLVEYIILMPEAWISNLALGTIAFGILIIFLGTGLSEEIIFRGILLKNTSKIMNWTQAILYVSVAFTAMHIGFFSAADLVFVFLVGVFFAYVVFKTRTLVGVIGCHTLLNIVLFMAAPYLL